MKVLIVIVAILTSSALPTEIGQVSVVANATSGSQRAPGFAGFGIGTIGGAGGATWTVWDPWSLRNAIDGNEARIIYVRGRLDLGALFTASPGIVLTVGSWKSIIGGDHNSEITGGGLRIRNIQQVIIQNIKFTNAISYAPGEWPNGAGGILNQVLGEFTEVDSILCETAEYVWIDHCEFSDDPWIANTVPDNRMRHDGLIDIKRASNFVTVSHNIFRNHNKNILLGHDDSNAAQDDGKLKTTFVKNWFMGTNQRNPRVRFGEVHVLNNLYTDIGSYGIGAGAGASIYAERNVFINSLAWRHPSGTPDTMGHLLNVMNRFENSNFEAVPSDVRWNPHNYYNYQPQAVNLVEEEVRRIAGTW